MKKFDLPVDWFKMTDTPVVRMRCGHCGREVGSDKGWQHSSASNVYIQICPVCGRPNFFEEHTQLPGNRPGQDVQHLPAPVEELFEEARNVLAAGAPTSASLALRKLLMHVAVEQNAPVGQNFKTYVDYFEQKNLVPVGSKAWIDHIRDKGNEANHEIMMITPDDANELFVFTEMLLRLVYEFPKRMKAKATP